MKYRPSHLKQFEKREERSEERIKADDEHWEQKYEKDHSEKQLKKQAKRAKKKAHRIDPAVHNTPDEDNRKYQHRIPEMKPRSEKIIPTKSPKSRKTP